MLNLSGYFVPSGIRLHNCGWCFLDVLCSGKPLPGLPLRIPGLILLAFSLLPNTPSSSYFILILTSLHVSSSREKETRMILTMNPKYPKKVSSRNRLSLPESTFCSKPTEGLDLHAGGRAVGKDSRISGLEQERNGWWWPTPELHHGTTRCPPCFPFLPALALRSTLTGDTSESVSLPVLQEAGSGVHH